MAATYSFNDLMATRVEDDSASRQALTSHDYDLSQLPRQVPHLVAALAVVIEEDEMTTLDRLIGGLGRNWWWQG